MCRCCWTQQVHPYWYFYRIAYTRAAAILASIWWNYCFFRWICGEIVPMEFDENLGIQALLPFWQSQLVIFTESLFIIGQHPQFCRLVPHLHDFVSYAHIILTVQSVRSVGFGMLIEQISRGANFMLIGPQENVSSSSQSSTSKVSESDSKNQSRKIVFRDIR